MKRSWAVALGVAALLLLGVLAFLLPPLLPPRPLKHLSASEFTDMAGRDPVPMFSVEWIGTTSDRAYLETRVMNLLEQWHTVIYWTELANLPPEDVAKLATGVNPWQVQREAEDAGR